MTDCKIWTDTYRRAVALYSYLHLANIRDYTAAIIIKFWLFILANNK